MSGCIDDSPVSRAIVEERPEYMQKPFTPAVLVRKVREILDQ